MRNTLSHAELDQLDNIMNSVNMSTILAHLAAQTYEAEDSVGSGLFGQMAAALRASEFFCKFMEREMGLDSGEECE